MGTRHSLAVGSLNHAITANPNATGAPYDDIAARDADAAFQIAANINKAVRVTSPTDDIFILMSVEPTVWSPGLIGGFPQTPWAQDIDAASFDLNNLENLRLNAGGKFFPNGLDTDTFIYQNFIEDEIGFDVGASLSEGGILLELLVASGVATANFNEARLGQSHGGSVASASILTLPKKGNTFDITGAVLIDEVLKDRWLEGSVVRLTFGTVGATVGHASGGTNEVFLANGEKYEVGIAGEMLTLVYEGPNWREVCRSGPFGGIPSLTWDESLTTLDIDGSLTCVNVTMGGTFAVNTGNMLLNDGNIFQADAGGAPGLNIFANRLVVQDTAESTFAGPVGLDSYIDLKEIITPTNPTAAEGRLYARDDAGITKLFFLDDVGTETDLLDSGNDTWTEDTDADGFDLTDLANLEFRISTVTPAIGTPSIYHTAIGLNFDLPTGDGYNFQVNGSTEYDFNAARADFLGNRVLNLGRVELSIDVAPADADAAVWLDAGGMNFNIPAGDVYDFFINGISEMVLTGTQYDFKGKIITNTGPLEFTTGADQGPTVPAIWHEASGQKYNTPNATSHSFRVNGVEKYDYNVNRADFNGNDLINVGNTLGNSVASMADGVVQIFVETDFPGTGSQIDLAVGTVYELMAPITTTRTIKHPVSGGAFSPATIRTASKEVNKLTYGSGATAAMFSTQAGQGQLVLQNLIIINDASNSDPVFDVSGLTQTALLTELDDTSIFDNSLEPSTIENCIFNVNNASFLNMNDLISVRGCEVNIIDAFAADFSDSNLPGFEVRYIDASSAVPNLIVVRNTKLSSHPNQSFFVIHVNQPAGTSILLDGVTASPFTPGTGDFFGEINGSVAQMSNSIVNPGTHTRCHSSGHSVLDGDVVTHTTFADGNYNGTFVAINVVDGVTYDIEVVFAADDNGLWKFFSVDQTDTRLTVLNSDAPDSETIGTLVVGGNSTVTTISTQNVFVDFDLGSPGAVAAGNIERFTLTNATTGEIRYDGQNDVSVNVSGVIAASSSGGGQRFNFQLLQNGSVLPSPDNVDIPIEVGNNLSAVALIWSTSIVQNDLLRIQVENADGTSNITIDTLKLNVR